jgi:hypothetical protein
MMAKGLSVTPLSTFYRKHVGLPSVFGQFSDGSIGRKTPANDRSSGMLRVGTSSNGAFLSCPAGSPRQSDAGTNRPRR